LGAEKEKAEKSNREDYSRRATRIGQLEDRIRDLLELELRWLTDLEPEGRLLEVNPTSPHVIINLGSSDRVVPGLIFEVFQYDRGKYVEKGMIEVVQTQAQIATCRVLNVKDARKMPLSQNDYIGNPVFSTRRPKVFVVSGEFKTHNKEDLEMFIRQTGGIVREKLSPGVDILVAGERSDKDQDNAREYAVHAMTEEQLLKYIRRDYAPK
jgi:NAD-dependent DNA ligase